jgi:DNA polymerase III subunit epsilon
MKMFFYDIETTGVKFWRNGIHQISGKIIIDDEVKETFNFFVKPYEKADIDLEALNVAGKTMEDLQSYDSMVSVYTRIIHMLKKYVNKFDKKDKFHLIGYNNASFDNPFFRAFFVQNDDQYFGSWFWSDSIDVMVLASNHLKNERSQLENFKQATVAKYLGIPVDDERLHDAMYDIDLCIQIYQKITG